MTNQVIGWTNQVIGWTPNQVIGQPVLGGFSQGIGRANVHIGLRTRKAVAFFYRLDQSADWSTSQVIRCRWVGPIW